MNIDIEDLSVTNGVSITIGEKVRVGPRKLFSHISDISLLSPADLHHLTKSEYLFMTEKGNYNLAQAK